MALPVIINNASNRWSDHLSNLTATTQSDAPPLIVVTSPQHINIPVKNTSFFKYES